ncbi:prolipoprotein diacylglyceryl transferase [Aurantimicrobium minutum]|uniref:prolipoprotein diacylglyceryl transferase n=1 Tax=Aurantimicrobium minutum TaxID=708131 RepID=UPI002473F21B|nr:prolipoprotein diacylglyceryl transferase [Aurantimicrobium minutum]
MLSSIPSPDIQFFDLGPIRVHIYALCILLGIILATWITDVRLTRRGAARGSVLDIILWAVPLGIIGARFYHVFTHSGDYFYESADLLRVFYIWEGGNAIFGSLLGGAVGAWIGCKQTGIRFWSFADALAPAMLVAQAAGRLGNYFNHELFGVPTTLPWGLEIEATNAAFPAGLPEGTLFHPMFLYEIIWNLVGVIIIVALEKKVYLRWGKAFGVYLIWYGIGRSIFETYRLDPSDTFLTIRTNVWAALAAILIGLLIILIQNRRHPGRELSVYVDGAPTVKLEG